MPFRPPLAAAPLLLLAACGEDAPAVQREDDPAMTAALGDPLMTDPDLVAQNRATNAALLPDGDGSIPVEDDSPAAIAVARAEALELVGGPGRMTRAPQPRETAEELPPGAMLTAAARAAAAPGIDASCAAAASYGAAWAARMPAAFPVYPRAAVHDAAGTDEGNCALRVVEFTTPVSLAEVIDFYFTRAGKAGFSPRHVVSGGETKLGGAKGSSSFMVYASRRDDGMTVVDLVTNGS